jgi:hypothetical protein
MAEKLVNGTANQTPNLTRREFFSTAGKLAAGAGILLIVPQNLRLVEPAYAQANAVSREKALAWAQEPSASKSAPFGAKTINIIPGKASLSIGSKEVDIAEGLKKIGLQMLSSEAKIAYGGKDGADSVYLVTDKDSLGVLKVTLSDKESVAFDKLAYPTPVVSGIKVVDSGFSLSAASPSVAIALNGTAVRFFDFGEVRIRRTDLAGFMSKEAPESLKNLRVVAKKEGGNVYAVVTGDKTANVYVFDQMNKAVQTFQKSEK